MDLLLVWKVDMETMEMVGDAGKEKPDDMAGEAVDPLEVGFLGPKSPRTGKVGKITMKMICFLLPNVGGETTKILVMFYR